MCLLTIVPILNHRTKTNLVLLAPVKMPQTNITHHFEERTTQLDTLEVLVMKIFFKKI